MRVPLLVEMEGRTVVCVGGGPVATAKVLPLAAAGADVVVISPTCTDALAAVAQWRQGEFTLGDLDGNPVLVVAGTGDASVDEDVADAARAKGLLCLRIDGKGTVAVPSVVRRSSLVLAMSTGAPALTKRLREHLEVALDPVWADAADTLSVLREDPAVRQALAPLTPSQRRARWSAAVDAALNPGTSRARDVLLAP